MAEKKKTLKRFGPRYGRKIRQRLLEVELEQKKKHKCPYCHNKRVKRVAVGIWNCKKCGAKFTGRAYTISKEIRKKESEV